jgi:hypothetical protein
VPLASRSRHQFRTSLCRPIRDGSRHTWYAMKRVAAYGHSIDSYRRSHGSPPLIVDPPATE